MNLSKKQQATISRAVRLLNPFNKEEVSHLTYYFEAQDEEWNQKDSMKFNYYDCCGHDKCIDKTLKELRKKYPKEKVEYVQWGNDGDHNQIDSCYQCGRPLNSQLTWIREEFEHHETHSIKRRDLKRSRTAFNVICLLEAMPTCDETISGYEKHQSAIGNNKPMEEKVQRMKDFNERVCKYAELVISVMKIKKL